MGHAERWRDWDGLPVLLLLVPVLLLGVVVGTVVTVLLLVVGGLHGPMVITFLDREGGSLYFLVKRGPVVSSGSVGAVWTKVVSGASVVEDVRG